MLQILAALRASRKDGMSCEELVDITGEPSGRISPELVKMERAGLLVSFWVPGRRFYHLTEGGKAVGLVR
jgi:DNA-binding PadR family transcriptional regulator